MTPVGSGPFRPSLGLLLPATTQGELAPHGGITEGTTEGSAGALAALCQRAERAGAASLWAADHLFWPHPIAEAITTLAVAATVTSRPVLGTCVLQLPLRQPAVVAKQAATLQMLSGGRFVLGLGIGSHAEEYQRVGVDFHDRGALMDDALTRLRTAWWGDPAVPSDYGQHPAAPPIPVWFGGSSAAARRRAAAHGDGWVPLFVTAEDYGAQLAALRTEAMAVGRDPDEVEPGVVAFVHVSDEPDARSRGAAWLADLYRVPPKAFQRHLVAGSAGECAAALWRYVEAGAQHLIVMVAGSPAIEHFEALREAFDDEIEHRMSALVGAGRP